jgi:hypothetical protein
MADYKKNARTAINGYLWQEITSSGILVPSDYNPDGFTNTLIPIIPSQQVPEFNNLLPNRTYLVYDYEVDGYSDDWWVCHETMIYSIISPEYSKIVEVTEFIIDLFRRIDISGLEVQEYNQDKSILKFYSVSLESAASPAPSDLESGRASGTVEISYKYSRVVGNNGRFQ